MSNVLAGPGEPRVDGLDVKHFHEQVSNSGTDGRSNDCSRYLLTILTLEEEKGVLKADPHQCNDVLY